MRLEVYNTMLDLHEVNVSSIDRRGIFGPAGRHMGYRESWALNGTVRADGAAALQTKYEARQLAFGTGDNYTDSVKLFQNDGTTVAHQLVAAGSRYGVRCKSFRWITSPHGPHANFVNYRNFYALFEAEYPSDTQSGIYLWKETIRQSGGGRNFELLTSFAGLPIDQTTILFTPYTYHQYGAAIGLLSHPTPSGPFIPSGVKGPQSSVAYSTPEWPGLVTNMLFPVQWSYLMQSITPAASYIPTLPDPL